MSSAAAQISFHFLDDLVKTGPEAVAAIKRVLNGADEAEIFAELFGREECREGMSAFLERRPASWSAT